MRTVDLALASGESWEEPLEFRGNTYYGLRGCYGEIGGRFRLLRGGRFHLVSAYGENPAELLIACVPGMPYDKILGNAVRVRMYGANLVFLDSRGRSALIMSRHDAPNPHPPDHPPFRRLTSKTSPVLVG